MTTLNTLYQEMIIDHGRRPRNFGVLEKPDATLEGFNPLCGDRLTVFLKQTDEVVQEICFQGAGCAISMASASLMTESVKGKTTAQIQALFTSFHQLMMGESGTENANKLGKLTVLGGVAEFPSRVKCATLAWHTLMGALQHQQTSVSTEDER